MTDREVRISAPGSERQRAAWREILFDPVEAVTVAEAPGKGTGHWVGAPGACLAGDDLFVVYRVRRPQPIRGNELVIARWTDGAGARTVWTATKEQLGAISIERCALVRTDERRWRLFVSFVDEGDRRWRIETLEAASVDAFDPSTRRPGLLPDAIGVAAVKDPWIRRVDGTWYLFVSFGPLPDRTGADLHRTGDALSTGRTGSFSGLATSADGERWDWRGSVLVSSPGRWDAYTSRLTTAIRRGDGWIGLYDGSTLEENYEERCGIAFSDDLAHWRKGAANGPAIGTPRGAGGVRYVEAVEMPDGSTRFFFEYTREDGSHDLRTARSPRQKPHRSGRHSSTPGSSASS
jgi:hypothetical protein